MRYVDLLGVGIFYFKIFHYVLAFFFLRYLLLQLSLWDNKYIDDKVEYYYYYRSNPINFEQLSYFLISTNCKSSKKL